MWKTFFQGPLSRPGQPLTPRTDSWRPHRLAGMFVRAARSCPQTRAAGLGKRETLPGLPCCRLASMGAKWTAVPGGLGSLLGAFPPPPHRLPQRHEQQTGAREVPAIEVGISKSVSLTLQDTVSVLTHSASLPPPCAPRSLCGRCFP